MILHTPTRTQMDGRTHLQAMEVHMRTYKPTDAKADTPTRMRKKTSCARAEKQAHGEGGREGGGFFSVKRESNFCE